MTGAKGTACLCHVLEVQMYMYCLYVVDHLVLVPVCIALVLLV